MVGARCYIIPPPPMTFHLSLGAGYLLMSVPHCSAWLRSCALLRLARISPSFKRECSMAVQEASREKEMQEHDGKQRRGRDWPQTPGLWRPLGPQNHTGRLPLRVTWRLGAWGQHALFPEGGYIPTVEPLETIPRGLTSRGRVQLPLETRYVLTQAVAEAGARGGVQ